MMNKVTHVFQNHYNPVYIYSSKSIKQMLSELWLHEVLTLAIYIFYSWLSHSFVESESNVYKQQTYVYQELIQACIVLFYGSSLVVFDGGIILIKTNGAKQENYKIESYRIAHGLKRNIKLYYLWL